jgi:hypothetical protein
MAAGLATRYPTTMCASFPGKVGLVVLLACCTLGACKTVEAVTPLQATLSGQVEFSVSGGFAGIRQSLTVDGTGLIVARDDRRGKVARGQLDPVRLAEIWAVFMKINPEAGATTQRSDARCMDCFQYTIMSTAGGRRHRASVSSAALSALPYGEVVKSLSQILRETLSQAANVNE